jgi:NADH dehydrogenase FAD-containing subunit
LTFYSFKLQPINSVSISGFGVLGSNRKTFNSFSYVLLAKAAASLTKLGVTVQTNSIVTNIVEGCVTVRQGEKTTEIAAETILLAGRVKASRMGRILAERTG